MSAWVQLRNRLISRSFIILFTVATNFYLLDVFLEAYAKNALPSQIQQQITNVFGHGMVVSIYLGSVFEALFLSGLIGFIMARTGKKKTAKINELPP